MHMHVKAEKSTVQLAIIKCKVFFFLSKGHETVLGGGGLESNPTPRPLKG